MFYVPLISDMEEKGKLNGKYPVFNDILAFVWCKMNIVPRNSLLAAVKSHYKYCEVVVAWDLLVENTSCGSNKKLFRSSDILLAIHDVLLAYSAESSPLFVAIDLNNIPVIHISEFECSETLICSHLNVNNADASIRGTDSIKNILQELSKQHGSLNEKLSIIEKSLDSRISTNFENDFKQRAQENQLNNVTVVEKLSKQNNETSMIHKALRDSTGNRSNLCTQGTQLSEVSAEFATSHNAITLTERSPSVVGEDCVPIDSI